ncbi:MAG: hypothetical protein NWQ82_02900 [Solirubrobacteraceae bacterium]|jgi:hypothetical protein|nr:hypothetical protein [Solirubrobacteraceae bacterium]MDP4673271.1 hypothetical protein [Solirubrobacteraceae bacterium]MDP4920900.1 hypothetical protein [Solirubrobacteraceae bacterium]
MSAFRDYDVIVTRTGLAPGRLAPSDRFDHIEVVSVEDLEVVLFWDVPARVTGRMEASLRDDLQRLESEEFIARWSAVTSEDDY